MTKNPRPWWAHLAVTALIAAVVAALVGLSYLARWALGEFWGQTASVVAMVLACATWSWFLDSGRRRKAGPR